MMSGRTMLQWLATAVVLISSAAGAHGLEACRFVQLCDTQLGMGGYEADVIRFGLAVEAINALDVDWVVVCGDLVNDGNDDTAVADFKRVAAGFSMPVYLAPGNHDVGNEPNAGSLERYRKLQGKDYYAAMEHGYKLVIANTQLWKYPVPVESEKHDAWFTEELLKSARSETPTLIVSHYPPFVSTPDEADDYYNLPPEKRKEILARVKGAGVRAWLAGHVHKNIVLDHEGVPVVASATTSKNFDGAPFGFRVWEANEDGALSHRFVALEIPAGLIPEAPSVKN
ncbi:MAG: metallophosphoesterase [Candidatus Hydrogenedentes bacterium]|nr:metallophosphoesterase [Candidatus Hydrogenedentota bacterium]